MNEQQKIFLHSKLYNRLTYIIVVTSFSDESVVDLNPAIGESWHVGRSPKVYDGNFFSNALNETHDIDLNTSFSSHHIPSFFEICKARSFVLVSMDS